MKAAHWQVARPAGFRVGLSLARAVMMIPGQGHVWLPVGASGRSETLAGAFSSSTRDYAVTVRLGPVTLHESTQLPGRCRAGPALRLSLGFNSLQVQSEASRLLSRWLTR